MASVGMAGFKDTPRENAHFLGNCMGELTRRTTEQRLHSTANGNIKGKAIGKGKDGKEKAKAIIRRV